MICCSAQLHTHMEHVLKHQNQQRAINLNNAESQTMHLETRLVLLDSSIQIELWQVKSTLWRNFALSFRSSFPMILEI